MVVESGLVDDLRVPIKLRDEDLAGIIWPFVKEGLTSKAVFAEDIRVYRVFDYSTGEWRAPKTWAEAVSHGTKFFDFAYYLNKANKIELTDALELEPDDEAAALAELESRIHKWRSGSYNFATLEINTKQSEKAVNMLTFKALKPMLGWHHAHGKKALAATKKNLAAVALCLLLRAKYPNDREAGGEFPPFVRNLFKDLGTTDSVTSSLASFDIQLVPGKWIQNIDWNMASDVIKNRIMIGLPGYRHIQAICSYPIGKALTDQQLLAVNWVRMLRNMGYCWEIHPLTRGNDLMQTVGSFVGWLETLMTFAFTKDQLVTMVRNKVIHHMPIARSAAVVLPPVLANATLIIDGTSAKYPALTPTDVRLAIEENACPVMLAQTEQSVIIEAARRTVASRTDDIRAYATSKGINVDTCLNAQAKNEAQKSGVIIPGLNEPGPKDQAEEDLFAVQD